MIYIKKILLKLLYPHIVVALTVILSAVFGLVYVFYNNLDSHPIAYAIYLLSFYALGIACIKLDLLIKNVKNCLQKNKYSARFLSDFELRARTSLYIGTFFNMGYAVFKLVVGIIYSSFWFGAVAIYYITLSLIRFLLIRADRKSTYLKENTYSHGWKTYRLCGILLLVLNVTMSGMAFQMIWLGKGNNYPGFIIYAFAAYTFYRLTIAIIKMCGKKITNHVLLAARALDLSMAIISMFVLQTAMLTNFSEGMPDNTVRLMNLLTGGGVCIVIIGIAVFMIIRSTKKLLNEEQ